jgi:cytochrome c oxidase subunit 2
MADLWWLMLGLGTAVFVVFAVLLGLALFRKPSAAAEDGSDDADDDARAGRWILGWGVVGPAVVILVVFVATVYAMRATALQPATDGVVIDVTAHQWWYEVSYPQTGATVRDELHLPVGEPVTLRLTSADVIHSFWVPELGGKLDMLPDGVNTLVLQADEPGEHVSRCAEFCGLEHATMRLTVVAEPVAEFEAWVASR